ncbi:MAG: hypothetical protein LC749_04305, partial [Actinobacteria bacterium]|nr:hypothetical protein [Actinomycetota bacterium]
DIQRVRQRAAGGSPRVTQPPGFDPFRALRVLDEHSVRYIVIGGLAANLLGAPLVTGDLDICYDRAPDNLERLAAALVQLKARLRVARVEEELPFILDARTLAAGDSFTFVTDAGSLDILGTPSGTSGYQDLVKKAKPVPARDLVLQVVDIADLMRMKRAAGRVKDRLQLEVLAALQDRLEEGT